MGLWYISAVSRVDRSARLPVALLLALLLASAGFGGCGYRLAGSGIPGTPSIAIRTPRNDSFQPGVEMLVADALRRELLRREASLLVEDPGGADVVVSGRVLPLETQPQSFSSAILAREQEITLALDLEAVRRDGQPVPVARRLRETERYYASADIEAQRKNRDEALRRLAQVLAARFFDEMGEALSP